MDGSTGIISIASRSAGMVANFVDAAIYAFVDKDYGMMALSLVSCVTMGASSIAKSAKANSLLGRTARYIAVGSSQISNGASFLINADLMSSIASVMINKYVINGQSFGSETAGEFVSLGLNVIGSIFSLKGLAGDTSAMAKLFKEDNVSSRLSKAVAGGVSRAKLEGSGSKT